MADEYILKRNALAILMGDKVDLSPNFVSISMAIDPSNIARFKDLNFTCDRHIDLIKAIPSEDVAPVVHGKWVASTVRGSDAIICSECGSQSPTICETPYCSYCGTRMDGKA